MNIDDFGEILFGKPGKFYGAAIFEAETEAKAKLAHAAGASAVVLTAPHAVDNYSSLIETRRQIKPTAVIVKARVGHYMEAAELQALRIANFIDENELLGVVDDEHFINKRSFTIPFICGCRNLGGALKRVREGACVLRIQGNSRDIAETVRIVKSILGEIATLADLDEAQLLARAAEIGAPADELMKTKQFQRLPVPFFAAGGIVTAADAALMIRLGCDGVFVNPEALLSEDPVAKAKKILKSVADAWRRRDCFGK